MKSKSLSKICLLFSLALPMVSLAQNRVITPREDPMGVGAQAQEYEFTLGANGASSTDMDDSIGGLAASLGYYLSDTLEISIRQTADYVNPDNSGSSYNGSTRVALDQHLAAHGALRPFVGINLGYLYGDSVNETWAAGLEAGAKFYVKPKTFIFAMVDYSWLFDHADDLDDRFDDGALFWNAGIGFNF